MIVFFIFKVAKKNKRRKKKDLHYHSIQWRLQGGRAKPRFENAKLIFSTCFARRLICFGWSPFPKSNQLMYEYVKGSGPNPIFRKV